MLTRGKKTGLAVLVLAVFLGGGLFLAVKNMFFSGIRPAPSPSESNLSPELEKELRGFLSRYLDAYKNAREKKNYEELKGFLSQAAAGSFSGEWITDVDDYQIEEISRPAFLVGEEEQYAARVEIFKKSIAISPPSGDTWPVFIVRENGEFKVKTWFFNLPGLTPSQ